MEYRQIGKTGMQASIIGLGCEYLDGLPYEAADETIGAAIEAGINIMDAFMPGQEVRRNLGRALKGRRDKMMIQGHVCSTDINEKYDISRDLPTCKKYFEGLLRDLDTDYIDFGMYFFMDSDEALKALYDNGIVDYMQSLKKAGTVRSIGASSHNPVVAAKLVEDGLIDMLMFSINPAFDLLPSGVNALEQFNGEQFKEVELSSVEPARAHLYRLCQQRDIGITVMKTLCAGRLLRADLSPLKRQLTVGQCIHYALSRPAVSSVLLGCQNRQQIADAVNYLTLTEEERDYSAVLAGAGVDSRAGCVYCSHCQPCPVGIDIALVNRYLDIALLDEANIPATITAQYKALEHHGSDCIQCGSCEERCPFSVPVIENMARAAGIFGQ